MVHTQESYDVREQARKFPMMIVISFVYVCNANCPNCPYNNSSIRKTYNDAMVMSNEIFRRIAEEAGKYRSLLRLSGGGEPMLHPDAIELILYAKKKGCRIGLITNGSRFTQNSLQRLIQSEIDAIEFSVDAGDVDSYSRARPGLDWDILNCNVKMAVEIRERLNSRTRIIASIISQKSIDVDAAEAHWSKIVDKVQIRKFLTWGINENHSADTTPYLPPEQRIPCPWLFERLNIDSRGDVTLCGEDIAFEEKFANIQERSIKDIWNGPEFNRLRELHLGRRGEQISICRRCPDWKYRSWRYNYWKVLKDAELRKPDSDEAKH